MAVPVQLSYDGAVVTLAIIHPLIAIKIDAFHFGDCPEFNNATSKQNRNRDRLKGDFSLLDSGL